MKHVKTFESFENLNEGLIDWFKNLNKTRKDLTDIVKDSWKESGEKIDKRTQEDEKDCGELINKIKNLSFDEINKIFKIGLYENSRKFGNFSVTIDSDDLSVFLRPTRETWEELKKLMTDKYNEDIDKLDQTNKETFRKKLDRIGTPKRLRYPKISK